MGSHIDMVSHVEIPDNEKADLETDEAITSQQTSMNNIKNKIIYTKQIT